MTVLAITALLSKINQLEAELNLDPLTQVSNRRAYEKRLLNPGQNTFIFIDVDNFKPINDTLGHAAGDRVLREIAAVVRVASSDTVYRIGGDEFAIVLSDVTLADARCIASRIALSVSELEATPGHPCSVSWGVGCSPEDADQQMYEYRRLKKSR